MTIVFQGRHATYARFCFCHSIIQCKLTEWTEAFQKQLSIDAFVHTHEQKNKLDPGQESKCLSNLTLILSMPASILSCSTSFRACAILLDDDIVSHLFQAKAGLGIL